MQHLHLPSLALATATLALGTPVFAQQTCGFSNGEWIGGSETASDLTTADAHQEQMALVLGGNEYVGLFSLSDTTDIRLEAEGRGAGDPLLELFEASGNIVLSDDETQTPLSPKREMQPPVATMRAP